MSGITRSTPSNSDSGNIIPASTTKISSPNRNAIMFIPNSPSPPRGITVSDCLLLLNEGFSPQPNFESYHTAPRLAPRSGHLQVASNLHFGVRWLCHRFYALNPGAKVSFLPHTSPSKPLPLSTPSLLYFYSPVRTPTRGTPPPLKNVK